MNEQNDWTQKWLALVKCGGIIVWYYLSSIIVQEAVYIHFRDKDLYIDYVKSHENKMMIVIYLIVFLGIWAFDKHKADFIGAFCGWDIASVIKCMLMAVGAYLVCTLLTNFLLPYFPDYEEMGNIFKNGQVLLSFASTVILPPLIEEYLFRHKMQGYLKKVMHVELAVVIQAVIFGLLHGYMIQKIYATLIGIFFGYVDERKGTVQCSIVMHMTINCIGWVIGCFGA